jgi:hypothetical protein
VSRCRPRQESRRLSRSFSCLILSKFIYSGWGMRRIHAKDTRDALAKSYVTGLFSLGPYATSDEDLRLKSALRVALPSHSTRDEL